MKPQENKYREIFTQVADKMETANLLLDNNKFADAVSRAYYAVFHAVSALLLTKELVFSSHAQVIGSFNREFIKTGVMPANLTSKIQELFNLRQLGDYTIAPDIDIDLAKKAMQNAEDIIRNSKEYLEAAGYL